MDEIKTMKDDSAWELTLDQIGYLRERLTELTKGMKTAEDLATLQPLLEEVEAVLDKYKSQPTPKKD